MRGDAAVETSEYIYTVTTKDLSGDGLPDKLAVRYATEVDGLEQHFRTSLHLFEGDTGTPLWTRRVRTPDTLVFPWQARLGPKASNGLILIEWRGAEVGTSELRYTFRALNGKGEQLWRRSYQSAVVGTWPFTYAATNHLVSVDSFDANSGRQTDLLVAFGEVVDAWTIGSRSGVVRASILDGSNGRAVEHPVPAVGLTLIPRAGAIGDIDDDRRDDYVFVTDRPGAEQGEEGADEPVSVSTGVVEARGGTDGIPLWVAPGLDPYQQNIFFWNRGDVVGDRSGDLFIETSPILLRPQPDERTYLVDGGARKVLWSRRGGWPYLPGDISNDGRPDILTMSYYSAEGYAATRVWGHTARGRRIWSREYRTEHLLQTCCSFLIYGDGTWGTGDHNGDSLIDGLVGNWIATVDLTERFLVDAASGKVLMKGDESFFPLRNGVSGKRGAYATVEWAVPGTLVVEVRDTKTKRLQIASEIGFELPLDPKGYYLWVESARLNRDRCADISISIWTRTNTYEVVINGATGRMMWGRGLGSQGGRARTVSHTDSNPRC